MAKQVGAAGQVRVQVSVDGNGNVVSARALTGHPLLRSAAENAARQSKMRIDAANMTGQIVYNFRNMTPGVPDSAGHSLFMPFVLA